MSDIRTWLDELGLGEYAEAFEVNAVDLRALPALTEDDLKELGLKLGHRRILQQAVAGRLAHPSPDTAVPETAATAPGGGAERRQLTVMFCDLVGSTALSESMDPEDYRELLSTYQDAARSAMEPYEGYIARYMGDGLLVYFGYPQAHEDDAERAVRAGLDIVATVQSLDIHGQDELAVRIGVATGPVVAGDIVGEGASEERAVLGDTPNLAARLQGIASPNSLVISEATRRLVHGGFALEFLGTHTLKGISKAAPAYRALAVRSPAARYEAAQGDALAPLLGRDSELALLEQRWLQACAGEGQAVLLEGEPGIGKSRLLQGLRERLGSAAAVVQRYQCSPFRTATAFHPATDLLERAAQFSPQDDAETKLAKLAATVTASLPGNETAIALMASLLSLPVDRYPPLRMTAPEQRAKTIDVMVAQLAGLITRGPVLMLFEDVHWSDPSTIELLDAVIDRIQSLPVLTLVTFRPGFDAPWTRYGHVTAHSLNRLGRREVNGIVASVTHGKALPEEILAQIAAKTDGIPLFVEELTKTTLEAGFLTETTERYILEGPIPSFAIPSTLHDALLARLDRLSEVKEIAQIGACIGRTFSHDLLAAVAPLQGDELDQALDRLTGSELVFRRGEPPDARYTFKHALVQDAAYQSLLRRTRQGYHERIARVLESQFPTTVETEPELLAHHYTEAGLSDPAVEYWYRAGLRAGERSAHVEAIAHLSRGLDALGHLPEDDRRAERELDLQAALGTANMVTRGQSAPETARIYERARELCEQVTDSSHQFPVLWGLWYIYLGRGELQAAREQGQALFNTAEKLRDAEALIPAHRALGNTLVWIGEFTSGCRHLEDGVALFDQERHLSLTHKYGQDLSVVCGAWASWARWILGYPDRALDHAREALARAEARDHLLSRGYALNAMAWVQLWRGDGPAAEASADAGIAICKEQGFSVYLAWLMVARGGAIALQGRHAEGVAALRSGLSAWEETGIRVGQPKMLCLLAEAYLQIEQPDEALKCLAEARSYEAETGDRFFHAELERLQGKVLLSSPAGDRDEAEGHYHRALETARHQQARSLELRAGLALAELLCDDGRNEEARDVLAPIHDWFTEGFDTRDLKAAAALLDGSGLGAK